MEPAELDFDASAAENDPATEPPVVLDYVEYESPSGEKYRIERGADLMEDFGLSQSGGSASDTNALQRWHSAMCNQEPAWSIICRIYGNAKLYGVEDPDELRVWTIAELAEKRGVEPRELDAHIEGAKTYWKRYQLESESRSTETIRARPAPDAETAEQLLLEHGFSGIDNEEERKYIAARCVDLQPWLESDHLRAAARSLIQQEAAIFYILDPTIRELRNEIRNKLTTDRPGTKPSVEKENSQLLNLLKERRDAQTDLNASMKTLGLTDAQGGGLRKKLAFQDCLGALVQGIQKYYAEDDREMIDGFSTAAEVEISTTPTTLRPAQYRPDLIVSIAEAKQHLWEADWSPTPISRRACRKLKVGFDRGIAEARSEEGEVGADEATEEGILDESAGDTPAATGPIEAPSETTVVPLPRASTAEEPAAMFT